MKSSNKLLWLAAVILSGVLGLWVEAQNPVHLVLMHTNDLHGQLLPRNGVGGIAEIATIIRNAKPDLVLDAGDLFTGTYLSDEFKGVPTIQAMNAIGYTAGTVGNHEFDYGQQALRERLREAKFPVLSANVDTPIAEIKKFTVVTIQGIRVGIVGVTTAELPTTTHPRNLQNVKVVDVVRSIQQVLPELKKQSDLIIVTAHATDDEEKRIAAAFPEIPLIVGGHNHSALGPIYIGNTVIAKTGSSGRNVGRVDLFFEGTSLRNIESRLIPVEQVKPDPEIAGILAPFESRVLARMKEVIGETSDDLANSSTTESNLANLVADALRSAAKTQIGIQNVGGIRARIGRGPITWGAVFEVLPFQNTIATLKLTGAQLKKMLNLRLLAVSGLRVRLDLKAPAGAKLVSVTFANGAPLNDSTLYSVATNDFVVAGGDGLSEFPKGRDLMDTGISLRDALVDYLQSHRPFYPIVDGRVSVVP